LIWSWTYCYLVCDCICFLWAYIDKILSDIDVDLMLSIILRNIDVFSVCSDSQCAITFCVIQVLSCSDSQCAITFCVIQVLSIK